MFLYSFNLKKLHYIFVYHAYQFLKALSKILPQGKCPVSLTLVPTLEQEGEGRARGCCQR